VREYLLICVVALAVTYLMTPFVRALAVVIKAVTPLRERDVHTVPIPRLGGVAIFAGARCGDRRRAPTALSQGRLRQWADDRRASGRCGDLPHRRHRRRP
jgi:hypothetical protein